MRGLVNEEKAKEFDELHAKTPKRGKNNKGAKELAGGYTRGNRWIMEWKSVEMGGAWGVHLTTG